MDAYRVLLKASVEEDLRAIPRYEVESKLAKVGGLAENPRPAGCEKLTGQNRFRLRLGKYRIVYSILEDESAVCVYKIAKWEKD